MLFDTHCHIQFSAFRDDADEVIKKCIKKDVVLNVVGSQKDTSERAIKYAEKYDNIYATVGLHPIHLFSTEVDEEEIKFKTREENFNYEFYKNLAWHPKTIGIGECGLELYHLPEGIDKKSYLNRQKEVFIAQYRLAKETNLPIVIHTRDAHPEMIELLNSFNEKINGVVHCYTGNWEYAQKYLALGLNIGFTGVITFPPKKLEPQTQIDLLEVVKKCPLDKILIETDAPYLAPQIYRGKKCEPWMVEEVAKKIAEIKEMNVAEISEKTYNNAKKLFFKVK
ncbi:MAG: TatD family hydrolase [Patescibacteria group bacterium]|nr:TatD family hydrolase [Patescibacteria group bacterium]